MPRANTDNPLGIRTAVSAAETKVLVELAHRARVLEIGNQYGYSTIVMARVAKVVHSVDWHRGDKLLGWTQGETLPVLWGNLAKAGVREKVVLHVGSTEAVLPLLRPGWFTFAFHDGYHATDAVIADAMNIRPLLRPDAPIAFHDYDAYGVAAAIERLPIERLEVVDKLFVGRFRR